MIIVVSDVHLAEKADDPKVEEDDKKFADFLDYIASGPLKDGGELVLLGDIFDLWRRDFVNALMESEPIVSRLIDLGKKVGIHYVVGNHDYHMLQMSTLFSDKFPFRVSKDFRLQDGGKGFYFLHGYQLEVLANPYYKSMSAYETFAEGLCLAGDDTGNAADKLWETIGASKSALDGLKRLPTNIKEALDSMMNPPDNRLSGSHKSHSLVDQVAISKARSIYLGMSREETLIFGHTHDPFKEDENRVVNTGSWKKHPCREYSYLEISGGQVQPRSF